jgi:hypothetical protein
MKREKETKIKTDRKTHSNIQTQICQNEKKDKNKLTYKQECVRITGKNV